MPDPNSPCPANLDGELDFLGAIVTYHGTWDGVSLRTDPGGCAGSLVWVRGQNPTQTTLYAHFAGRKGTPITITMQPGFDTTYTNPQLRNNGFQTIADIEGLIITNSPDVPV